MLIRLSLAHRSGPAARADNTGVRFWDGQSINTMGDHRSLAPSRLGQVGMARVDRGVRVAKGEIGAAIDVPPRKWVLFQPTTPALSAATISKVPLKPLLLPD